MRPLAILTLALAVACGPTRTRPDPDETDARAPVVALQGGASGTSRETSVRFEFTADEAGCTFTCRLDGGAASPCVSPANYDGLAQGAHLFVVEATDAAGNHGEARRQWAVDSIAPVAQIASGPTGTVTTGTATFTFMCDDAACTFECALDERPFAACGSPLTYSALEDGDHRFQVRGRDAAGNVQASPALREWNVDAHAPETLLDTAPGQTTGDRRARFAFHSNLPDATYECALDGEPYAACTSPFEREVPVGPNTFFVRAVNPAGHRDPTPARHDWSVFAATLVRVAAANVTSGPTQRYEDSGIRILKALGADVALLQEFNFTDPVLGTNTPTALRSFVDRAFGTGFEYSRELAASIPNGVVSRWPIVAQGEWDDPIETTRDFAWARIDLPGPRDLWAVSVHLRSNGWFDPATGVTLSEKQTRDRQAQSLLAFLASGDPAIPAEDYLVFGGDLNSDGRNETCLQTLRTQFPDASGPWPVDQAGNGDTSATRTKPLDWLVADAELSAFSGVFRLGSAAFPSGLVFDTRVFTPLDEAPPALATDSASVNMQHMAIVRAFYVPQ